MPPSDVLSRSFQLLSPNSLLSKAFMNRQLKRFVFCLGWQTTIMSSAAIADNHVFDQQVQNAIKRRRADQDRPCQPLVVEPVSDRRCQTCPDKYRHAER